MKPRTKADEARNEYGKIRKRSGLPAEKFDLLCKLILKQRKLKDPRPQHWLEAAQEVKVPCERCAGTGEFITMVLNGRPTGPGGVCFRCQGKGYQTDEDRRRNWGYDAHQFKKAAFAMMREGKGER